MKTSHHRFINPSKLAALAAFGLGAIFWCNVGHAQENAQVLEAMRDNPAATTMVSAVAPDNQVPYLSTYYIQPKVDAGKDIDINYYVTDFDQKEYLKDDHSETFTVDYWVNGAKNTLPKIKAGDNSFTIKPLPKGEVLFALQVTDAQGRKSHRLFQKFLVVDPADRVIPQDKILSPDLQKFGIFSDDTHPVETTKGLTEMLKWASDNGYRKVVLPKGRYRLDENSTVQMATRLTLDMNGSTFKLNPNALGKSMMFEMVNCFDSHVMNGTFEGDLKEHDFKNAPNDSEWVNAIGLGIDTQYSSFENLKVVDVTGYGTNTEIGGAGTTTYSAVYPLSTGTFTPGDIDAQGKFVPSESRTSTEKPVEISAFLESHGFIQLGVYLGYQGNPAGNWVYKASFYDADEKFIESIEGYMYRRMYPPKSAKFARFTLLSKAVPENLALFNFRPPYNCAFINVHHENVRCVGMAPSGFMNLLVEGNTFENCGFASAKCAFDSEDGWDMMQDLTFRNNVFGQNPHNEFLMAAGHNFVMENNTMKTYMWDRSKGATFRNNTLKSASFLFGNRDRSGYPRISHNTIEGGVSLNTQTKNPDCQFAIRDNICKGGVSMGAVAGAKSNAFYYQCKIAGGGLNAIVVESEIKDIQNVGGVFEIYGGTIENSLLKSSGAVLAKVIGSTITNSHLTTQGGTMLLENNTIVDSEGTSGEDWSPGHEWILRGNKVTTSLAHLVLIANSYKQVVLEDNTINSSNFEFVAVLLNNPTKDTLINQVVSITGNTFNAQGGAVLGIPRLPDAAATLTVNLFGNTYNGIDEFSVDIFDVPNIKVVREEVKSP